MVYIQAINNNKTVALSRHSIMLLELKKVEIVLTFGVE